MQFSADMYDELARNTDLSKIDRQNAAFSGGESYRFNHKPKQALKMYLRAEKYGATDPIVKFRIAQMHKQLGRIRRSYKSVQRIPKKLHLAMSVRKR